MRRTRDCSWASFTKADGLEGTSARLPVARNHGPGPLGVATECGFGRRAPESVVPLLALH